MDDASLAFYRKYDVRLWVLVTSIDPLRVFVLRHGYPKIASELFETRGQVAPNSHQCAHIKLLIDPECDIPNLPRVGAFFVLDAREDPWVLL